MIGWNENYRSDHKSRLNEYKQFEPEDVLNTSQLKKPETLSVDSIRSANLVVDRGTPSNKLAGRTRPLPTSVCEPSTRPSSKLSSGGTTSYSGLPQAQAPSRNYQSNYQLPAASDQRFNAIPSHGQVTFEKPLVNYGYTIPIGMGTRGR